jgi:hypothetical protein
MVAREQISIRQLTPATRKKKQPYKFVAAAGNLAACQQERQRDKRQN